MPTIPTPSVARLIATLLALLLLAAGGVARADSQVATGGGASASLMFAIHLPVVLRLNVRSQPPLRITQDDIARGFVETSTPQEVLVTSNTTREYALRLDVMIPRFARVTVSEQQHSGSFGAEGLTLVKPPTSPSTHQASFRFHYRFELTADMAPGDYPWPLALSLIQP